MAAKHASIHAKEEMNNKYGYPHISYPKAVQLIENGNSCLFEAENEQQIGLPPQYVGKIDQGIRETLDGNLLKYSEELEGIIVTYRHVQCLEAAGSIFEETPFLYFTVKVKYVIFRPKVGEKLRGIVNKNGHSHFGCLVHECFNASVQKPKIHECKYKKKELKKIAKIDIGTEFIFRVTRFDVHNDILSIKGKIDKEDIEGIRNIDNFEMGMGLSNASNIADYHETLTCKEGEEMKKSSRKKKPGDTTVCKVNGEETPPTSSLKSSKSYASKYEKNNVQIQEVKIKNEVIEEYECTTQTEKQHINKKKRKHSELIKNIKLEGNIDENQGDELQENAAKKKRKNKS